MKDNRSLIRNSVRSSDRLLAAWTSYAAKLVTVLGKEGGVSWR
jgi:hypothetical protein